MNKKFKKIFFNVLHFALVFILSICCLTSVDTVQQASADELQTNTFESGAIIVNPLLTSKWTDNGVIHNVNFLSVESFDTRFTFTITNNKVFLRYYVIFSNGAVHDFFNSDTTANILPIDSWNSNFDKMIQVTGNNTLIIDREFYGKSSQDFGVGQPVSVDTYNGAKLNYAEFYYNEDVDVNSIYKVEYYSGMNIEGNLNTNFLYINFYDIDNNYLFRFAVSCGVVSDRLIRYMNSSVNGTYEQGYQDGYNADKNFTNQVINDKVQNAYNDGYEDGVDDTLPLVEESYYNGFVNGRELSNTTFGELMFSVGEVPFGVVRSMLEFELLGMNISHLVLGLLTGLLVIKMIFLVV